jgi:uncharacterized protein YidB (DUF937 family)
MTKNTSMPSLMALLGLAAVAGFQNRDKIREVISGLGTASPNSTGSIPSIPQAGPQIGGLLSEIGSIFGGNPAGTEVSGGLGQLVQQMQQAGHGQTVDSWIGTGTNQPITTGALQSALGTDVINALATKTGMDPKVLLDTLSKVLPGMVDQLTPGGVLPTSRTPKAA